MQRRAAAVYFALFVLLGAGAFGFLQVGASQPAVELDGPAFAQGEDLTAGGVTYTVTAVETGGGGEGGDGGGSAPSGEVTWFNESYRATETVDNESTVQYADGQYRVLVGGGENASGFRLVQQFNVSAILAADDAVEDQLAEQDDRQYVVYANGTIQPLDEYLPDPAVAGPFSQGDRLQWQTDNETVDAAVESITNQSVAVSWDSPQNETIGFEEGQNVTLGDTQYFAHFPGDDRVQLLPSAQYFSQYQADLAAQDYFHERQNGLWGIVFLSFLGAIVLLTAAYLPVKG